MPEYIHTFGKCFLASMYIVTFSVNFDCIVCLILAFVY